MVNAVLNLFLEKNNSYSLSLILGAWLVNHTQRSDFWIIVWFLGISFILRLIFALLAMISGGINYSREKKNWKVFCAGFVVMNLYFISYLWTENLSTSSRLAIFYFVLGFLTFMLDNVSLNFIRKN